MVIGPVSNGVLGLVGLILVLIALKGLSDNYNEKGIFDNALYGIIAAIIGVVVFVAGIVVAAVGLLSDLGIAWSDWGAIQEMDWRAVVTWDIIEPHIAVIIGSLVALFVFVVVSAIFLRRSLTILSAKTKVNLFGTAGLLILIGAILSIIVVGFILIWVALVMLTVAFFSIKT
jgi:uncharacterized membrane protein